jgi:methylenetetrahydrofolate reductase (NADPH)
VTLDAASRRAVAGVLRRARYEVLPLDGIEDEVHAHVPTAVKLTVTASPRKGLDATLTVAERLAARGYQAVPHISARLVRDRAHLEEIVGRLRAAGVRELFVPAGDPREPAGDFASAAQLLATMGAMREQFQDIGITGYPESHPLISDEQTIRAMFEKAPMATCIISQLCFDAQVTSTWVARVRARRTTLPIWIGVPGIVDYPKLARIAVQIGIGDSTRFLSAHRSAARRLVTRRFNPDRLIWQLGPCFADARTNVSGIHVYTFNEVARTERWRQQTLARLDATR